MRYISLYLRKWHWRYAIQPLPLCAMMPACIHESSNSNKQCSLQLSRSSKFDKEARGSVNRAHADEAMFRAAGGERILRSVWLILSGPVSRVHAGISGLPLRLLSHAMNDLRIKNRFRRYEPTPIIRCGSGLGHLSWAALWLFAVQL